MKKLICGAFLLILLLVSNLVYATYSHYGPTQANEHLFRIALQIRPDPSVSVQQVMIAILHANPQAFKYKNINGMRSGYHLRIPSIELIKQIPAHVAINQVDQQNSAWLSARNTPTGHRSLKKGKQIKQVVQPVNPPVQEVKTQAEARKSSIADFAQSSVQSVAQTPVPSSSQSGTTPTTPDPYVAQLPTFIGQTEKFEQQTNIQLVSLQQQTKVLEAKVLQLSQDMQKMTYNVVQLTEQLRHEQPSSYSQVLNKNIKDYGIGLVGSILLLTTLIYLYKKAIGNKSTKKAAFTSSKEEEYDFLNDQNHIHSKLDLARAYIDMGDDQAAKAALQDVLLKGNQEQRLIAKDLLSRLNSGL